MIISGKSSRFSKKSGVKKIILRKKKGSFVSLFSFVSFSFSWRFFVRLDAQSKNHFFDASLPPLVFWKMSVQPPAAQPAVVMLLQRICGAGTHFEVLGVPWDIDADRLRTAFRNLVLSLHPDRCDHPLAGRSFQLVQDAYRVLKCPETRLQYEKAIGIRPPLWGKVPARSAPLPTSLYQWHAYRASFSYPQASSTFHSQTQSQSHADGSLPPSPHCPHSPATSPSLSPSSPPPHVFSSSSASFSFCSFSSSPHLDPSSSSSPSPSPPSSSSSSSSSSLFHSTTTTTSSSSSSSSTTTSSSFVRLVHPPIEDTLVDDKEGEEKEEEEYFSLQSPRTAGAGSTRKRPCLEDDSPPPPLPPSLATATFAHIFADRIPKHSQLWD